MDIRQPRWKAPEYTKKQINEAGVIIRNDAASFTQRTEALIIIDNWRSAHAYPLHVFYMNLKGKAGSRTDILVAERLKRMESIVGKLKREEGMQLYRMQDLGGCRMVLPTLSEVYAYSEKFQKSRIRHEWKKTNDADRIAVSNPSSAHLGNCIRNYWSVYESGSKSRTGQ